MVKIGLVEDIIGVSLELVGQDFLGSGHLDELGLCSLDIVAVLVRMVLDSQLFVILVEHLCVDFSTGRDIQELVVIRLLA